MHMPNNHTPFASHVHTSCIGLIYNTGRALSGRYDKVEMKKMFLIKRNLFLLCCWLIYCVETCSTKYKTSNSIISMLSHVKRHSWLVAKKKGKRKKEAKRVIKAAVMLGCVNERYEIYGGTTVVQFNSLVQVRCRGHGR